MIKAWQIVRMQEGAIHILVDACVAMIAKLDLFL
jgi:hypothetical protein